MAEIHFWLPRDVPPELGDWDPDLEPNRFVSILWLAVELYQRLAAGGVEVSIGATPEKNFEEKAA